MLWARVCGCGGPTPSPWPACPVGAACRWGGGGPSAGPCCVLWGRRRGLPGGVLSAVVGSVRVQALPPPRLPACWAGCRGPLPVRCGCGCASVGVQHCQLSSQRGEWPSTVVRGVGCQGAGPPSAARPLRRAVRVSLARRVRAWGHRLHAFHRCAGRLVRRFPSTGCPPSGRAVGARYPRAMGAGVRVWGPSTVPLACAPFQGRVPRGWWGAVPGGGGLPLF